MGIFSKLFGSGTKEVIGSIGDSIDKVVTSDEERAELRNALAQIEANAEIKIKELSNKYEADITSRWKSDNEHIITRLIRPISYATMILLFVVMVVADGNLGSFAIKESYQGIIETVIVTMTFAYFGGRSIEKYGKIKKG